MSHLARVPSMQSAANFMMKIFAYNRCTMTVGWRGMSLAPALFLAAVLLSSGVGVCADDPRPSPSPTPQDTPAPEGRTIRSVFGTIMGTVFDTKKQPLAGWMVQLSSRGDDSQLRVTGTDDKGQYVFKDLPAGTCDIEIQTENEAARRKGRIEVRPPFRNIVDFQVGPQPPEKPGPLAAMAEARKKAAGGEAAVPDGAVPGDAAGKPVQL